MLFALWGHTRILAVASQYFDIALSIVFEEDMGTGYIYLRLIWHRKETPWKVKPEASRND